MNCIMSSVSSEKKKAAHSVIYIQKHLYKYSEGKNAIFCLLFWFEIKYSRIVVVLCLIPGKQATAINKVFCK